MSKLVETTIDIDGVVIKQFSTLKLSQGIFAHHVFRLVCPAEAIDGQSDIIFNASKNLIGLPVHIKMMSVQENAVQQFSGIVTHVEAERRSGYAGNIIISGFSPTILLDISPDCKTWERNAIKNIVQDVLSHFPSNLLRYSIAPSSHNTLSYFVQYKETAWQLINRLASVYGEWLYFDGEKLVMGLPKGSKTNLTYGVQLSWFSMCMQLKPPGLQMLGYDYLNNEVYASASKNAAAYAGLDEMGRYAMRKSMQLYDTPAKQWYNYFLSSQKQLDETVTIHSAMQSSDVISFKGSSDMPGMQPGSLITVKATNLFNLHAESLGDFTITAIDHYCDGQGNYFNDFMAVPATVKVPPVKPFSEPHCETQSAIVVDNNDLKKLGRVRVKFHWMNDTEKSPWLRVATPYAGNGKGIYILPEIGEEVLVAFEGDNPLKPYIVGAIFHGKAKTDFGSAGNDIKAIQTRSGNKIIMNDQEGSIQVEDKNGNKMKMDGNGNIRVSANQKMVLECGSAKIELVKDGTIHLKGSNVEVTAAEDAKIKSGKQVTVASKLITLN